MKCYFSGVLLKLVTTRAGKTVSSQALRSFLSGKAMELQRQLQLGRRVSSTEVFRDLWHVRRLMTEIGMPCKWTVATSGIEQNAGSIENARQWLDRSRITRVFSSGVLVAGAGRHLDSFEQQGTESEKAWARENTEVLLRQVEVRRKRWLHGTSAASSADDWWLEWHDVAILFSRLARRKKDLRMLNAAFKLNDWAFRRHQRSVAPHWLARYLLALAEQEAAAAELLQ